MESLNELPPKKLQELELLTSQLLNSMKRTGLERETVYAELTQLHSELGRIRRERFDSDNPNFTQHSA